MKNIKKISKILTNLTLFLPIILGILLIVPRVPFWGSYKMFIVQSGSMEPAIQTGSIIFVKQVSSYDVGDIITKKTSDERVTVTHRIVEKNIYNKEEIFKTKGDANDDIDIEECKKDIIIGKEFLKIPYLGYLMALAKTPKGLFLAVLLPAIIIICEEIFKIKRIGKQLIEEKKYSEKNEN